MDLHTKMCEVDRKGRRTDEVSFLEMEPVQMIERIFGLSSPHQLLCEACNLEMGRTHVEDVFINNEGRATRLGVVAYSDLSDGTVLAKEVVQVLRPHEVGQPLDLAALAHGVTCLASCLVVEIPGASKPVSTTLRRNEKAAHLTKRIRLTSPDSLTGPDLASAMMTLLLRALLSSVDLPDERNRALNGAERKGRNRALK